MVPQEGVEPPRLSALDPKSSVSANSTTRARGIEVLFDDGGIGKKKVVF